MERQTFRKSERLSSRKIITHLFEKGKVQNGFPFKALWDTAVSVTASKFPVQMCVAVPKKSFRKAHDRNSIKRKVREAYRKNKASLYLTLNEKNVKISLLLIYVAKEELTYENIENKMIALIEQLKKNVA
ncbi:MAG: ribonuclease P protein component [Bacteroidetes bacterium]|nr:ribonuclease P protein component [Bacteroidota bacterium]